MCRFFKNDGLFHRSSPLSVFIANMSFWCFCEDVSLWVGCLSGVILVYSLCAEVVLRCWFYTWDAKRFVSMLREHMKFWSLGSCWTIWHSDLPQIIMAYVRVGVLETKELDFLCPWHEGCFSMQIIIIDKCLWGWSWCIEPCLACLGNLMLMKFLIILMIYFWWCSVLISFEYIKSC